MLIRSFFIAVNPPKAHVFIKKVLNSSAQMGVFLIFIVQIMRYVAWVFAVIPFIYAGCYFKTLFLMDVLEHMIYNLNQLSIEITAVSHDPGISMIDQRTIITQLYYILRIYYFTFRSLNSIITLCIGSFDLNYLADLNGRFLYSGANLVRILRDLEDHVGTTRAESGIPM